MPGDVSAMVTLSTLYENFQISEIITIITGIPFSRIYVL